MVTESCLLVMCPCPHRGEALRIGDALVREGLAAAVNIIAQESVFRWRAEVRTASEYLLLAKCHRDGYERMERKILDMHSYELPGIVALPMAEGYGPYLTWLRRGGVE